MAEFFMIFHLPEPVLVEVLLQLPRPWDLFNFALSCKLAANIIRKYENQFKKRFEDYIRLNQINRRGFTALLEAVFLCKPIDYLEDMLQRGAKVNFREGRIGESPLGWACSNRKVEIVKLLLKYGADPCFETHGGLSALWRAVDSGNFEIIRLLCDALLPRLRQKDQKALYTLGNAIAAAAYRSSPGCLRLLLQYAFVSDAVSQGVLDVELPKGTSFGMNETTLGAAYRNGSYECAELLLAAGVSDDILKRTINKTFLEYNIAPALVHARRKIYALMTESLKGNKPEYHPVLPTSHLRVYLPENYAPETKNSDLGEK